MVNLSNYIVEKLKINKDTKQVYHYHPKNYDELENLIKKLLEERGKDADLNDIDVSEVTEMWELFYHLDPHNINISKWDVSNVTAFTRMFLNCKNFNCDLSEWNMSNATHLNSMFMNCSKFNCNLENWKKTLDSNKIITMDRAFHECESLDHIPSWYNEK